MFLGRRSFERLFTQIQQFKNKTRIHNMALNVETKSGPVQGHLLDDHPKRKVVAFYGIPFAEPPVGKLRFRPPVPVKPWSKTFMATELPKKCSQVDFALPFNIPPVEMTEDCLILNVWVPEDVPKNAAVMIFIHGGAFVIGSSLDAFTDGMNLAAQENVIVVTIAYRVGPLGFLYLGTEDAPGNVGLLDQQLALKWVKENIAAFGGCPNNITIFGVSAGGASVGYHILSQASKGLFNRAIMLSGTPTNPWAFRERKWALRATQRFAKAVGYTGDIENKSEIVNYLTGLGIEKFEGGESEGLLSAKLIGPTVDGNFLTISPREAVEKRQFNSQVDLMIGATSDEAAMFFLTEFPDLVQRGDDMGFSKEEFYRVIKRMSLRRLDDDYTKVVGNFYIETSKSDTEDPQVLRDLAIGACGDSLFAADIDHFAEAYQKSGNRVFKYLFDQQTISMFPKWAGAFHGSDQMITLATLKELPITKELKVFGHECMRRWANFARTGEPSLNGGGISSESPNWPEYKPDNRECLILKNGNYTVAKLYRERENAMWYHLLKLLEIKSNL